MATAGEGTAAAAAYEGGGAGGKFRKRPLRRNQNNTPYDRPPTALRNSSWLTKLVVDPASKLITSGAQRFFSSIFQKRLPPSPTPLPPPPPGPSQESKDLRQESSPNEYTGALVVAGQGDDHAACSSADGTFSELEQLLKQKTFTRTEINRLTELLRSKAADVPMGDEEKRAEAILSRRALDSSSSLMEGNRSVKVTSGEVVATPVTNSRILEDDIASPAELAKAYMGSRSSKVSPSMLSTRSQAVREDTPLLRNVQYVQKSPLPSATTRTAGLLCVRENGFTTPRSHGRSAIYSMARTPYSRVRQTEVQKATSLTNYVNGGCSSSRSVSEHDVLFGSKQALKRRSYVLDDDLGSVGPMRRIRQKPNLLSFGVSRPSAGVASASNLHPEVSKVVGDVQDNKTTPTRHIAVPPKSSETAAKILEHLEKMTPKGKSSESKLAAGKENKLTPNMLHGRALRSLEDLDSPKLLQSARDSYKLENWSKIFPPNPREAKQGEIEQNGRSSASESAAKGKNDTIFSFKDTQPTVETNSMVNQSATQPPPKKRAFKMSAHEDSFELEEDIHSNGPSSQLAEGRGKLEISAADQKPLCAAEPTSKPAALLEVRTPSGVLGKNSDTETPDSGATAVKNTIFLPSAGSQSLATASNKETNVDKVPPFVFSSSTQITVSKPGSSSGVSNLASSPTGARPNPFQLDNSQKAVDSNGKLEASSSGPSSSISASGIFSLGAPSSTSSLSNGLFAPSPAISTTSALLSGSSTASASSLFGSSAASSVSKEPPIGFFGVPSETVSAPSTTSTAETTDVNAKSETGTTFGNLKSSPFVVASFAATGSGNSISGFSSSVMSAVTTGSTQSQGSVFSTGGESLVSAQTSVAGSGTSVVSGSKPAHFGSSASSPSIANFPVFGSAPGTTGQVSASPSKNDLVGTSSAASGIFNFGASSSASSAAGRLTGSINGTAPLAFAFSASSAAPASETSVPATSSSATPGTFNFGGSSSASSTNAVNISSSTTPNIFNFGGSSSTSPTNAVNTSTSATPGIFNFGANSSSSLTNAGSTVNASPFTFGATSASSQASSTAGNFGSSLQPQKSPGFTSPFSSSALSGFTFGASSSSFATPSTSPMVFGATPSAASGSAFLFGSASSTNSSSQPMFGNSASAFAASPGNNDNMEDSMAEDLMQAPAPAVSFGQPSVSPSPGGFVFGSTPSTFQFGGGQQSQTAPQNSFPFAASSSLVQAASQNSSPFVASSSQEFGGGGSFSLGSSGPDKSGRKFVKINKNKHRRK
ncbi:PREDICTED: nuclear pore complex protein NUP1 isoform X2 [Nicotiana attenuata]|uniref:Nuclear pore complex protein nup1 n=1 Tax=Nicotiana attenuata TaxID=49451 RepID=A0A314LB30_NICAT|nr:PREDICTED: nuclear pore complex protein NUP1 isoform X2 [Nicotiana attenuata]OIT37994.1 nuclear pore complex protein nup1 [Nicotiana attenuata]